MAEVERLAGETAIARERFGEQQVGGGAVLDVEVVANELSVAADDRTLAAQRRTDRAGHEPVPVQIAAAVQVRRSGVIDDRQAVA